jgi:PPOX class probable F420-dependent enzyme
MDLDRLAAARYVLLTTFRKDGRAVPTPVWAARDGAELLVWTAANSGKVKRIRRDGAVEIAPCNSRGKPKGDSVRGTARILDQPGIEHVRTLIQRKYGLLARLVMFLNRLRSGPEQAAAIAIAIQSD